MPSIKVEVLAPMAELPTVYTVDGAADAFVALQQADTDAWIATFRAAELITAFFKLWKVTAKKGATGIRVFVDEVEAVWETGVSFSKVQRAITVCEASQTKVNAYVRQTDTPTLTGCAMFLATNGGKGGSEVVFTAEQTAGIALKAAAIKAILNGASKDERKAILAAI